MVQRAERSSLLGAGLRRDCGGTVRGDHAQVRPCCERIPSVGGNVRAEEGVLFDHLHSTGFVEGVSEVVRREVPLRMRFSDDLVEVVGDVRPGRLTHGIVDIVKQRTLVLGFDALHVLINHLPPCVRYDDGAYISESSTIQIGIQIGYLDTFSSKSLAPLIQIAIQMLESGDLDG